jgi:hypothetical protein
MHISGLQVNLINMQAPHEIDSSYETGMLRRALGDSDEGICQCGC